MDVFEAMSTCRAMRYLKSDPIDDELLEQVITAATWAPSPGLAIPEDVHIDCLIPIGWPDRKFGPLNLAGYHQVVHIDGWKGDLRSYPPVTNEG